MLVCGKKNKKTNKQKNYLLPECIAYLFCPRENASFSCDCSVQGFRADINYDVQIFNLPKHCEAGSYERFIRNPLKEKKQTNTVFNEKVMHPVYKKNWFQAFLAFWNADNFYVLL